MIAALLTIMILFGLAIIFLTYIQSGQVKSIGASISNTQDLELFENKKIRGTEKFLNIITWFSIISFFSIAITLFVVL